MKSGAGCECDVQRDARRRMRSMRRRGPKDGAQFPEAQDACRPLERVDCLERPDDLGGAGAC
eukprot:260206-Rhodomonas_salina.2